MDDDACNVVITFNNTNHTSARLTLPEPYGKVSVNIRRTVDETKDNNWLWYWQDDDTSWMPYQYEVCIDRMATNGDFGIGTMATMTLTVLAFIAVAAWKCERSSTPMPRPCGPRLRSTKPEAGPKPLRSSPIRRTAVPPEPRVL